MFSISVLGILTMPGILIMTAIMVAGAAYATAALARAGAPAEVRYERAEAR